MDKQLVAFVVIVVTLIALVAYWNWVTWSECRETFSFWTCLRIIGR